MNSWMFKKIQKFKVPPAIQKVNLQRDNYQFRKTKWRTIVKSDWLKRLRIIKIKVVVLYEKCHMNSELVGKSFAFLDVLIKKNTLQNEI